MPECIPRPWVDGLTVGEVLRATAAKFPTHDAVVFPKLGLRWSWNELDRRVDVVAGQLMKRGVATGEHVGIWSMNVPEWVVTQFAVGRIGAVLVNINPAYRTHELEETLRLGDVVTLIVGESFKTSNFVAMIESIIPEVRENREWSSAALPALRRLVSLGAKPSAGWINWSELESGDAPAGFDERLNAVKPNDVYNIQFTSGTTGLPKGAMLTHRNVLMNAFMVSERTKYTADDRVCVPVPFYHCFGCVLGTLACVVSGAAIVVPAPTFDPEATLSAIDRERCTSVYGVPTMFISELDHPNLSDYDTSSLRTGIMAGSPCPLPLMNAVVHRLGAKQITIGYGLTEASPIITMTSADDSIEVRVGTVGRVIRGVEARIVDPATRQDVPRGEPGELLTRGHGVMVGYYHNSEATARVMDADGWLATGDLARECEDGNYRIVGRCKELIIRGGENVYPPEVEEYLHHHPKVGEVAVVGLPDKKYGEVISAWIVPKPGLSMEADEVFDFCRGQIAHFKVPTYVEIVDSLPKTVTGKVRKHVLKAQGIDKYELGDVSDIATA